MKKIIKQQGGSYLIRLSAEDVKAYGLEEGDIVDVEIKKVTE